MSKRGVVFKGMKFKKETKSQRKRESIPSPTYEVECIIGKQVNDKNQTRYLVKWLNYADRYNSWEPAENLTEVDDLIH